MPEILSFRLYAPLASFGGVAVGEQRDGWDRPGRSALLGMVAACLGIERENESAHLAMEAGYRLGILVLHVGPVMIDYHTAQVPPARRGVSYATRAGELADRHELNTILTRRAYRSDVLLLGALAAAEDAPWTVEAIAAAMRWPRFVPYAGRKSCVLGLPLDPRLALAPTLESALLARHGDRAETEVHKSLLPRKLTAAPYLALDPDEAEHTGGQRMPIERRRDRVVSRLRWQFQLRNEAVVTLPHAPPCS